MALRADRRNLRTLGICVAVVLGMVGLSYASVPLYRLFCQVTGFGGTTQVAAAASETVGERTVRVRFDATVSPDLPWAFQPVEREVTVKVGENAVAYYRARNLTNRPVAGTATYNVTPLKVGLYFHKIQCFCFTDQTLEPGQSMDMPVAFFVDPAIAENRGMNDVTTITLSYTFYPSATVGGEETSGDKLAERAGRSDDGR